MLQVWAVGDRGRVVRWASGRCEPVTTGIQFAEGDPTYWGVLVRAPDDVWIVGGSPRPDGPRGILLHGDGAAWRQELIPERAAQENLYKIAADGEALYVVGSGGLILRQRSRGAAWERVDAPSRTTDNRLFTVSCASGACFSVGGSASGFVMTGNGGEWSALRAADDASIEDLPGLNGVWARAADDVLVVGVDGLTLHLDGRSVHRARRAATSATLHAVGGFAEVTLAVGGELSNTTPSQRGVILVQGDSDARAITLDGRVYSATGLQGSRGGAGQ